MSIQTKSQQIKTSGSTTMNNEEFARAGESATERNAPGVHNTNATNSPSNELTSERLANAMFLLRGWVWETDLGGRFTYISDSVLHFSGRPPQWHYGKTREELGNSVVDPQYIQLIKSKMKAREPFGPIEYQRIQDGKPFWLSTCGMPVFAVFETGGIELMNTWCSELGPLLGT